MLLAAISTEIGQAFLAVLVSVIGYLLHHKTQQIHVLVNQRMTDALTRIETLERALEIKPGQAASESPLIP